jgi:hypothetical protein
MKIQDGTMEKRWIYLQPQLAGAFDDRNFFL